ncbi:MAG: Gfo/Idh/MocA family oxidoreductase, partial [Clostridia bacterium]|nr:Gfo/Idh/MocA family oxidoreductase [Clostridia bacterium]
MIRAVIIGFAHMHVNEVALYIAGEENTELIGIADVPPKSPEQTEKRYTRAWNLKNVAEVSGAPVYKSYTEMLDELKPDYAYILCENAAKPAVAEECAKRGVNLVVEKPMAADVKGAEAICALPEKYSIELYINWPVAWRPYLGQFKKALDEKLCGDSLRLRYINGHTGPLGKGAKHRGVTAHAEEMTDEERGRIWWYKSDCGGGAFLDILCYGCYFSRWLFGKMPLGIVAQGQNLGTPYADTEDNTAALFRYENAMATAEGSWTLPRLLVPSGPQMLCRDGAVYCGGGADEGQFASACSLSGESIEMPEYEHPYCLKNMPSHIASHKLRGTPVFETLTPDFNLDVMKM